MGWALGPPARRRPPPASIEVVGMPRDSEGKGIAGWAGWALGLPSSQQNSVAILPSFVGWAGPLALPSSRQKEGTWLTCVRRPPRRRQTILLRQRRRETRLLAQESCFPARGCSAEHFPFRFPYRASKGTRGTRGTRLVLYVYICASTCIGNFVNQTRIYTRIYTRVYADAVAHGRPWAAAAAAAKGGSIDTPHTGGKGCPS